MPQEPADLTPEEIAADIQAWRDRARHILEVGAVERARPAVAPVNIVPQKRKLSELFRKKAPVFDVSDQTINAVFDKVRSHHAPRAGLADITDGDIRSGRIDIISPRGRVK